MASKFSFDGIGTKWVIDIHEDLSDEKEYELLTLIKDRINIFDMTYSRFREDSWISRLSKGAGKYDLPLDAEPIFSMYRDLYDVTGGLVTPLIGKVLVDAGYDKKYSLKQSIPLEVPPSWDDVIIYEPPFITMKRPAILDFGALGKGYLIDIVGEILQKNSIKNFTIDAGGDILYKNNLGRPIRVGLEHPEDLSKVIGVVQIKDQSIAGSSGNRRKWGKFTHIIDPKTLVSPKNILGLWVIADKAILADGIATGLFFTPAKALMKKYRFEYIILYSDHSVERSDLLGNVLELY